MEKYTMKKVVNIADGVYLSAILEGDVDYKIVRIHFHNAYVDLKYFYGEDYSDGQIWKESNFPAKIVSTINALLKEYRFPYGVCSKEDCPF